MKILFSILVLFWFQNATCQYFVNIEDYIIRPIAAQHGYKTLLVKSGSNKIVERQFTNDYFGYIDPIPYLISVGINQRKPSALDSLLKIHPETKGTSTGFGKFSAYDSIAKRLRTSDFNGYSGSSISYQFDCLNRIIQINSSWSGEVAESQGSSETKFTYYPKENKVGINASSLQQNRYEYSYPSYSEIIFDETNGLPLEQTQFGNKKGDYTTWEFEYDEDILFKSVKKEYVNDLVTSTTKYQYTFH